ncbi:Ig-like domain-containing protein [Streptomyces sp. NBC_01465]|uniref:Ig-like domain-containing protein n=1 Tax=Streptomyces sp. NBC_01465 TaxID=2903878 RepID=UPI002E348B08|nr:Ig-like domain-containing protein [Streptomyces sp. NBC_01465]
MNHLLGQGRAIGTEPSQGAVYAALYSSADPLEEVAVGDLVQLGLSVAPDRGAPRGCAYLHADALTEAAEIVGAEQLEYFPAQRWFRVRAEAGESRSGVLSLRVKQPSGPPRLRPQFRVAVPDGSGMKLIRTGRLDALALPVRTSPAAGLRILTAQDTPGAVRIPAGGGAPVSLTQPRHGEAQLTGDGALAYLPAPGFLGYDRFTYTVTAVDGSLASAPVNVHVGPLGQAPGAFPECTSAVEFHPWQWPGLTGEMPWPRSPESAQPQQTQQRQSW